jgi:hypothetical protein
MPEFLEKPLEDVEKILQEQSEILRSLISDWGGRIIDGKFVMTKPDVAHLWLMSGYFDGQASEALKAQPCWKTAKGVHALFNYDNAVYQEVLLSIGVTDESEFILAMKKANITQDMQERLLWVLLECNGRASLQEIATKFKVQEGTVRKFVDRKKESFEKTYWRVQNSKNNVEIFKAPKKSR